MRIREPFRRPRSVLPDGDVPAVLLFRHVRAKRRSRCGTEEWNEGQVCGMLLCMERGSV